MVRNCIWLLQISFQWLEFAFEWLESWMVRIWIWLLRISFEWLEFAFQWLESLLSGSNLQSMALNLIQMVWICIRMLRIPFEWFKFAFECLEPFRMVQICIRLLCVCECRSVCTIMHCKSKLVVLTTEWLPCLQSCWKECGFILVLETNCTRQPERQLLWSFYNHYPADSNP